MVFLKFKSAISGPIPPLGTSEKLTIVYSQRLQYRSLYTLFDKHKHCLRLSASKKKPRTSINFKNGQEYQWEASSNLSLSHLCYLLNNPILRKIESITRFRRREKIDRLKPRAANSCPLTPLDFLERCATVYGDCPSAVYNDIAYNWSETHRRCLQVASSMVALGINS